MQKDIIVFSGPSGVGKSTLVQALLNHDSRYTLSVSATTRPMRGEEVDGRDYHFLSQEVFQEKIDAGEFIEWEEVYPGIRYGSLRSWLEHMFARGKRVVFDIDVLGALNIKRIYGERAFLIFIQPESISALEARLRNRGTDSEESIQRRIARFEKELSYAEDFDYILVNTTGERERSERELMALVETL